LVWYHKFAYDTIMLSVIAMAYIQSNPHPKAVRKAKIYNVK